MTDRKNPFKNEQWLASTLISEDSHVQQLSQKTYQNFYKNHYSKIKSMTSNNPILNFFNFITKHAFLAGIIAILAFGTIGVSAAEAFAPKEYKPSQIINKTFNPKNFENNKQPEKNPYTSLKSDDKNDVTKLDKCDLAVKYPKKIDEAKIQIFSDPNPDTAYTSFRIYDGYQFTDQYSKQGSKLDADKKVKLEGLSIDCVDSQYQKNKFIETKIYPENYTKLLTKLELQQQTGWFLTEADITNIRFWDNGYGLINLSFDFKDKTYNLSYIDPTARAKAREEQAKVDPQSFQAVVGTGYFDRPGIFGNQVQIQFNSLVTNEANAEVVEKPKSVASVPVDNNPKQDTPATKDEFNLDTLLSTQITKCNLNVQYSKYMYLGNSDIKAKAKESSKAEEENYIKTRFSDVYEKYLVPTETITKSYVDMDGNVFPFGPGFEFTTFCFDTEQTEKVLNTKFIGKYNNGGFFDVNKELGSTEYKDISKSDLCTRLGIDNNSCIKIKYTKLIDVPAADGGAEYYLFTAGGKTYLIDLGRINNAKLKINFIK